MLMAHSTKKLGFMFTMGGWILGLLVLMLAFSKVLDYQANPNQSVSSIAAGESRELVLQRNRQGHYVFNGFINNKPVTFLVDTGATTTSIPGDLEDYLALERGSSFNVSTANGNTRAYATRLDQLKMGGIVLESLSASIVPGYRSDSVLLGMNVLKHMELIQRGDELTIRQPY